MCSAASEVPRLSRAARINAFSWSLEFSERTTIEARCGSVTM
jgi:hypothetical protein